MRFSRARGGGLSAKLSDVEASVLTSTVRQLVHLLGEPDAPDADPLAALVGLPRGDLQLPEDPALARLLPDAYRPDAGADPGLDVAEAAADFRRYTEPGLRAAKRERAAVVLRGLAEVPGGGRLRLARTDADAWLTTLNDLRLVLGTRLDVTEETDLFAPTDDEDTAHALQVYGWLGWLQESLLDCLDPMPPDGAG